MKCINIFLEVINWSRSAGVLERVTIRVPQDSPSNFRPQQKQEEAGRIFAPSITPGEVPPPELVQILILG